MKVFYKFGIKNQRKQAGFNKTEATKNESSDHPFCLIGIILLNPKQQSFFILGKVFFTKKMQKGIT